MTDNFFKRTWAQIDLDAIKYNYISLRKKVPESSKIMGIVKADAYGHGVEKVSKQLSELGISAFGVSSLSEAEQLRRFGIREPILILGYTPISLVSELYEYDITQTVYESGYAEELSKSAKDRGVNIKIHIKLDIGMGRLGFPACDDGCINEIIKVSRLENIQIDGIFAHFPSADFDGDIDGSITNSQAELFLKRCNQLEEKGVKLPIRHCCNSAGALTVGQNGCALDMVREGISLYGLSPSEKLRNALDLKPAMELKTVISMVKTIHKGDTVSYGRTFTADRDMKVATVCIGYADGYPRQLSGRGYMLVNGKKAPIIGRICMDQLILDVTGIEGVYRGMTVTVFGKDGDTFLSVDEVAKLCDTINYELICIVGKRIPRVFVKNGEVVGVTDYIKGE